jgi:peptidoglycan/xylan/chitin deacetylase (PgdA/CDA1 family)
LLVFYILCHQFSSQTHLQIDYTYAISHDNPAFRLDNFIRLREHDKHFGETEIVKWKDNKLAAISITYDDASINQFRQALPIMDTLGFKGTFFINTADIPGSQYAPKVYGKAASGNHQRDRKEFNKCRQSF